MARHIKMNEITISTTERFKSWAENRRLEPSVINDCTTVTPISDMFLHAVICGRYVPHTVDIPTKKFCMYEPTIKNPNPHSDKKQNPTKTILIAP